VNATAETLTERLTRTGEAILDLAAVLPEDIDVVSALGTGYGYIGRFDVELHIGNLPDGLRTIRALGGIWRHTVCDPAEDKVHHYWTGTFQGWAIRIAAIWDGSKLSAEDIVPMVPVPEAGESR
jgi:hypothetical protein